MKKLPEKLNGYNDYEKISSCMRKAVWNTLTVEQFENAWNRFITKYELQTNTWLEGLYLERKRWILAYVNDCFWVGMSSTQRSESMNSYFDGYINSKTTLKQFVEQYENAVANKVESENQEDEKSWRTYIPLITQSDLEKQFQSVYTNDKVREFHEEFFGRLECSCSKIKESVFEYEVKEWVTYGEGEGRKRIQVPFIVDFNVETNEAYCNCRLFEFKGMVCRHQLMVWSQMGVERVPDKYVFKRWCKNVKRVHTKIRISYDKSSTSIEAHRHDNICNLFNEVVDLVEDSQEKYNMVMTRVRELKRELMEVSVVCESNVVSLGDDTGTRIVDISLGDGVIPSGDGVILSKQSTNILDPESLRRKGRPPCKRKQGVVEKAVKKKRETKKKTLSNENVKGNPSCMGHSMWPNMMPHNMQANMAQGGTIFPFSPTFCPTGTSLNQFRPSFPSSQSLFNGQFWRGQSTITGSQVWGGGQSSFLEDQGQYWGGQEPSLLQTQGHGCERRESFTDMLNATNNDGE
ncbi:protein FAR1-RELATED SEQUENCE 1-like isoform X2 [Rhododendron vialii]|uniref:protein FAR1-RELATED SEQUENCE 1-like isoform X2 n=1 Tax=Rhododendron vialii TaxID=182163 RepID=UPI00266029F4|nr:protein FAR1-RELATED SEQUENCE 1-like isoform X2 [Rhododendron vialii]